ncbi:hypothetical protein [Nostoc sp. UHCC 0302]
MNSLALEFSDKSKGEGDRIIKQRITQNATRELRLILSVCVPSC